MEWRLSSSTLVGCMSSIAVEIGGKSWSKFLNQITNNWLELTVRFVVRKHGIRDLKDAVSRDLLKGFDPAGI